MKKHAKKLLAVLLTLGLLLGPLPTAALAVDEVAHSHDGWTAVTMGETYIKLGEHEQSSNTLTAGSYYLDGDISVPLSVIGEVNLCLNDHDVTVTGNNSRAITITSEATLNLYDCPGTNYGGTVLGQDAGISNNGGTVHVYGGTVTGNSVGIKNNVNAGRMTNFVYVHGGEVNGLYGIQNLSTPCEVHVSGGRVTGSSVGIHNASVYDNKIYLSGTPTISGNASSGDIYTDGSSSPYIYADDGAAENPTPYTGDTIELAYDRLNTSSSATAVCHVTAENKDKFALIEGHYSHHLEFTKYSSSSAQNDCLKITAITYTVTFNSNGGSAVDAKSVVSGSRVSKPTDPTKSGFVFGGWYSDEELTQAYDFTSSVTDGLTLYAKWSDAPAHSHDMAVATSAGGVTPTDPVAFTAWDTADAMPSAAGNYYLTTDVTLNSYWQPPNGVNLCLNGHVLKTTSYHPVIYVGSGVTLNICDCKDHDASDTRHKFSEDTVNTGVWKLDEAGTLSLTGGVITGGRNGNTAGGGGIQINGGTLNLYGGNIVGNYTGAAGGGGGVYVQSGAFNLYGGTVTGNRAYHSNTGNPGIGGGVSVASGAAFTMTGGTAKVQNNTAQQGGGIYNKGTVTLGDDANRNGSAVEENAAVVEDGYYGSGNGGGVCNAAGGTLNLSGHAAIGNAGQGNTARNGGGVYNEGAINMGSGGSVFDNTATNQGGGVYHNGTFSITGEALVNGNKVNNKANNLYLSDGKTVALNNLSQYSYIYVTTETAPTAGSPVNITGANGADCTAGFYSDAGFTVADSGDSDHYVQLQYVAAAHTHAVSVGCEADSGTQVEFTA